MKIVLLMLGIAAVLVGCGQGDGSHARTDRIEPGPLEKPVSKVRPGVEYPGEYPGGTNVQHNQNSNATSATPQEQPPFGTGRPGSYQRTNSQQR